MNKALILAALLAAATPAAVSASDIIPRPLSESVTSQAAFTLTPKSTIAYGAGLSGQADYLVQTLAASTGWDLSSSQGAKGSIVLAIDSVASPRAEGYTLAITPKKVTVTGHDAAGVFYGLQTLLQCFPAEIYSPTRRTDVAWTAPCTTITDAPAHPWRGVMLDAARYYYEPEYVERFIDMMAMYKLNKLQFHFIDDSGWRLESEKYPRLTEVGAWAGEGEERIGGFYTREQMRHLIDYAAVRGVEIIPEIEFPAHFLAAIVAYPWLSCTGEQHQVPKQHFISRDLICPGKESSMKFLRDILDETVDLFPSRYINIGGDEAVYTRWESCPDCRALMQRLGFTKASQLQGWLTNQVAAWMKERGRTVIGWEEIILNGEVSTPVVSLVWHNPADSVVAKPGGHKAILTPASHLYFDFPESALPGEPQHATWMPPVSVKKAYTMPLTDHSPDATVIGVQACMWSDQFIHNNGALRDIAPINENRSMQYVEHFMLPRMLAMAELGWTPEAARDYDDFATRMSTHFPRLSAAGYNYRVPVPEVASRTDHPDGSATFTLRPNVAGATIRYTTNGTWPTRHSAVYSGPVTVSRPSDFMAINMVTPRHYSLPLMQRRDYKEYSHLGSMVGQWKPLEVKKAPSRMRFDCSGAIIDNGRYTITFVPETGADTLHTGSAWVYKRDELIGTVTRPTGLDHTYSIDIDGFEAGTPLTLVVETEAPNGNDTAGLIFIKKQD